MGHALNEMLKLCRMHFAEGREQITMLNTIIIRMNDYGT